jgi:hypothetical protein
LLPIAFQRSRARESMLILRLGPGLVGRPARVWTPLVWFVGLPFVCLFDSVR